MGGGGHLYADRLVVQANNAQLQPGTEVEFLRAAGGTRFKEIEAEHVFAIFRGGPGCTCTPGLDLRIGLGLGLRHCVARR